MHQPVTCQSVQIQYYELPAIRRGIILGFLAILCVVPVAAFPITASLSTGPADGPISTPVMNASVYEKLGISAMAEENITRLLSLSEEGLSLYPDNPELRCLKAYALRKTGAYSDAADNVTTAIAKDPKPARYANRGFAYLAMGKNEEGLMDADTAIGINQTYDRAYGVRMMALYAMGRLNEADKAADDAIRLNPYDPLYWHMKGRIAAGLGNCTAAESALKQSLLINPGYYQPWPGMNSASVDLADITKTCKNAPVSPAPTKAPLLPGLALCAAVLTVIGMRRQ
ncbi:tetratricopeptide repeat protein [uncultured Methanoregula sp.]|uniref:tetratricopeptide repeat protein n=1 Tax=uncultured Methanoregula sp. TaxID=1005933 RepID=UPI002AAAD222|nr:tetratricopeptide repeat protein [uncultured Methanoregula sp.]